MVLTEKSRRDVLKALDHLNKAEEFLNRAFGRDVAKGLGVGSSTLKKIGKELEDLKKRLEGMLDE